MATSTRAECFEVAGHVLGQALQRLLSADPREAAERAYRERGPSVDELEARIRQMQAEQTKERAA